jgi:mono/diheme cytochrome c family protein
MKINSSFLRLAGVLLFASLIVSLATAQTKPQTVWDGAYTTAQATRGSQIFIEQCSGCHSVEEAGQTPLVGRTFFRRFTQNDVSDMLDFISTNMPRFAPGSLTASNYADVVAFVLKSNGFPAGTTEVGRSTSTGIKIVARDGPTGLPDNARAYVVGCLAKQGSDWILTSATSPDRPEKSGPEDATRPLGSRTITLKYVLTPMDTWGAARISALGQLMGNDGADGINVMNVVKLSDKCP